VIRTVRNPIRSLIQPPMGETSAPPRLASPTTTAIAAARPGPLPTISSTISGWYGRHIWLARNATP
jgi:hypothetical protein